MPADVSIRFRAESQQARKEVQILRGTLTQLNKTLVENRNALLTSTGEERKRIQAVQAANAVQKAALQQQIRETQGRKQAIADLQRETRERERAAAQQAAAAQRVGKAQEQAARRTSAAQSALIADLTRGARVVYRELSRVTTGFVSAAADMETFRNSVQAVTRDTTETNRILAELLQLTVELVGIETGTLISYAGRLMAAGLSAEEAITAIRGVTERIAEQGKSASVTARVMEQLTQSFNAGIATMQDFRPILREMPTFWRDASNALGVQITNLEDFRQAADAAGGNTQALLLVLAEMGRASEGANLDTLNAQIDILSDQARLLQAELGEHLIPAIVAIAKEVNVWIERFRNMDDRAQAAIAWAIALATALTGLSVIVGAATLGFGALSASLAAITGVAGVAGLTAGIGGLTAAFVAAAPFIAVGGIIVGGIALLAKAIRDTSESAQVLRTEIKRLDEVTRVYNLTTGQLEVVTASQSEAFAVFQQRVKNAQDDVGNISNLLRQNRMEQEGLNKAMAVASGDAIPALQLQLRGLKAEGQELSQALDDATNKLQGLQFEVAPDESTLTDPIESLEEQLVRAVDQVIRLRDSFSELSRSEDIQAIESAASNLTGALRRELALQLMDAELTAAERLDLQLSIARAIESVERDVQARITAINKDNAEAQADAVQRQTDARIESAERARGVEVAANEAAAASGAAYAEQLARIASPSQRQAYIDIVESFQAQGLSLDEARRRAEPYLEILVAVSSPIHAADQAFGDFTSNLVRGANESASAIGSLMTAVDALGTSIRENLPDTAGSLERSLLNEQRYNEQNPIGRTLDDIQGEAGEQGRNFVNQLFRRQDREAEKAAIEAQRESIQLYNDLSAATVDFTSSLIDLQEETNLADHAFQDFLGTFGRLATGDFTALLDIPIQLLNISRRAAAERQQGDQERAARREEQFDKFSAFRRNFSTISDILDIPEIAGLSDSLYYTPAAEFENVLAQSTADFSDGIKNALLSSVVNLERDIRPEDIVEIFQSSIDALGENLDQSQFNLNFDQQLGRDTADAYQSLINDTTAFYQAQIDAINLVRQATGNLSFGDPEALARQAQAETNQLRLAAPPSGPQNAQQFFAANNITRGLTPGQDDQERGVVFDPAEAERVAAEPLANVIDVINADVAVINASITSIETQISQASEPVSEIAALLEQIPALIETKYQRLRDALDARFNAGELSVDVYNASLSELSSGESSELERHSDAMLANVVRMIDEDIQLIDASITDINTQIAGLSDPEAIGALLEQIPGLITEKYTRLREALDAKYATGELSVDVYNASLSLLSSRESGEREQQSDAVLAQTIGAIDGDVALIDANIAALQLAVENSDDPDAVAGLLDAIQLLVMDKYTRLRERLDALLANEEISQTAYDAATTAIGTAESRELSALDAQGLNEISEATQAQVSFINGAISNLRTTLELTDDPAEVQQILEAIRVLVGARFDILRAELEAIRETLSPEEYQQAFDGLNLAERLAFQNLDTEVFRAISAAAQMQVDFINGGINNLRLSLQLTDDPAELEQILNSIKVLVGARFDILIQELKDIEESLDPEIFKQALEGLELGKLLGIQNIDREITTATTSVTRFVAPVSRVATEISNIALETAERQTHFIDGTLDNLRTSLALTDDPAEIQQILDAIKILTSSRFDSLRAELEAIRNTLSSEDYQQALKGLNLSETLAIENIDTEKFAAIRAEAQTQVDFVNGGIENLRLSIQLTDDPTQRQAILDAIKILLMQRFTILRTELENIRESLDPEDYDQALTGLNLGEQLSLKNLDTEKFGIISEAAQEQVDFINKDIENLRLSIQLTDDPTQRQAILDTIKILTQARFDILREELEAIRDRLSPEEYKQAVRGLNLGETLALENIDTEKFGVISEAAQKQVDFVNGAISNLELAFQLTDDPAEAQQILDAIKVFVAKRFEILIEALKAIEDTFDDPAVFAQALEGLELGSQVALRGIDDRSIGITLEGFTGRISETDAGIHALFDDLSEQTTASGINTAIARLRTAITTKYDLIRERIEASAENEETQAEQIAAVNVQEAGELQRLGEQGLGAFDSLINTAQFLLDNATEAQFSNRREQLITAINTFYDERLAFINGLDLSDTDRTNMLAVVDIQRNIAVEAVPQMHQSVTERLELEKDLQDDIADLRDEALENEADRQQALQDLADSHQDRLTDIEEDGIRRREDLQRESQRSLEDLRREFQEDQFDVGAQLDRGEITREEAEQQISDLTREFLRDSGDLQRRQRRALEDQGIREERQQEDAAEGFTKSQQQIETQARATATAIQTALTPLLTEQQTGEVAEKQVTAADKQIEAADAQTTAADDLGTVVTGLQDSDIPGAIDVVRQSAEASLGISSAISALPSLLESSFERIFDDLQETLVDILEIESGIQGGVSQDLLDTLIESEGRATGIVGKPTRPDVSMRGLSDLTARIGAAEALSATREVPTSFTADTVNVSGSVVNVSGGNRSGSRESETPQSRFPVEGDELRADITLEFPDGTIQEINNQMLRLKQQDRT